MISWLGFEIEKMWNYTKRTVLGVLVITLLLIGSDHVFSFTVEAVSYNSVLYLNSGSSSAVEMKSSAGKKGNIVVLGVNFLNTAASEATNQSISEVKQQDESGIQAGIEGTPLFYPNPAKLSDSPRLRYILTKNMDVEIRIFDMLANMISKTQYPAGSQGGKSGVNWLKLSSNQFDQFQISAGAYFVVIMNNGKVLGKGKVAIIP